MTLAHSPRAYLACAAEALGEVDGLLDDIVPDLASWYRHEKGRRLRLFSTAYTQLSYNRIRKDLDPSGTSKEVSCLPGDPNYWRTSPDYQKAHRNFRFKQLGGGQPSVPKVDVTDASHIYEVRHTSVPNGSENRRLSGVTLSWSNPPTAMPPQHVHTVEMMAPAEAASLNRVMHAKDKDLPIPIQSASDFGKLMGRLTNSKDSGEPNVTLKLRHPWSVFGGIWGYAGRPPSTFTGYLEIALRESAF